MTSVAAVRDLNTLVDLSATYDTPPVITTGDPLLYLLAQHAGRPMSRQDIYQHLHGLHFDALDRSIDLRISRLRRKLGDDPARPQRVKSIRGVGYMLAVEP